MLKQMVISAMKESEKLVVEGRENLDKEGFSKEMTFS